MEFRVGETVEQIRLLRQGENPRCRILEISRGRIRHLHLNSEYYTWADIECFRKLGKTNPNCLSIIIKDEYGI